MGSQTAAFLFTITITTLFLSVSPNALAMDCNNNDREALLKIREALGIDTSLFNWIPATNCCTWTNVACNDKGRVNSLSILWSLNARVPVPSAIGNLSALLTLNIALTPFYGPIPQSFENLSHLQSLRIQNTKISGPIHLSFGKFRDLQNLDLSRNQLTGPIPFLSKLHNLQQLDLGYNQFTGPIPRSLGTLRNLGYINLCSNQLTGSIPRALSQGLKNFSALYLNLAANYLTGNVPEFLGKRNWGSIDLSYNNLTGASQFLSAPRRGPLDIDLSWNSLRFDFTNVTLSPNIRSLILNNNRIRGSIPESLNGLKRVDRLSFSNNMLCGKIPAGVVTSKLSAQSFKNNTCLCGTPLPPCTK